MSTHRSTILRTVSLGITSLCLAMACTDDESEEADSSDLDAAAETVTDDAETDSSAGETEGDQPTEAGTQGTDEVGETESEPETSDETESTESTPAETDAAVAATDAGPPDAGADDEGPCTDAGACCDGGTCASSCKLDGGCGDDHEDAGEQCMPLVSTTEATGVDGGADCFPSCIASLQAACAPEGACGTAGLAPVVSCWDNDVKLVYEQQLEGLAIVASKEVRLSGELCYEVRQAVEFPNPGTYVWFDSCGNEVATGAEDPADSSLVTIRCTGSDDETLVDLSSDSCAGYDLGAPRTDDCVADTNCAQ